MKVNIIAIVLILLITGGILICGAGCANIIPPSGGPRDSLPPSLIKASPPDSTRNFKGNRITFEFDEYIATIQGLQENLIVSPTPTIFPSVESRLRNVTVKLIDSLEPNTTYTLNFGNVIKDYNENNVLKNFTYVFSTGPAIDSLELRGRVILAETGKVDTTLTVMLHADTSDSAVVKKNPRYIARLDGSGNFVFRNLPAGTFALYAIKSQGGYQYMSKTSLFAFADKLVNTQQNNQPITLYAYAEEKQAAPATPNIRPGRGVSAAQEGRLRFSTNLNNAPLDLFNNPELTFEHPLRTLDSGKVRLAVDSAYNNVPDFKLLPDTSGKKIQVSAVWQQNKLYHLILDKDFATDTAGRKLLKTDTVTFTTRKLTEYGTVSIRFRNLDLTKNPVLLFVQNDNVVQSYPLTGIDFSRELFVPGEYELRILNDANKNGKWDPGRFQGRHLQPELVQPINRRVTIRPNWQNEFEIALDAER